MLRDDLPALEDRTDHVRWCDIDVMIADAMTKPMPADKLLHSLKRNYWDLAQPIESVAKKRARQQQRQRSKQNTQDVKATKIKKDKSLLEDVSESDPDDHADGTGMACDPDDHADGTGTG